MTLVAIEQLQWEMSGSLCGTGPIRCLFDDGSEQIIKPGLGRGYWNRAYALLKAIGADDNDKVLPAWKYGLITDTGEAQS